MRNMLDDQVNCFLLLNVNNISESLNCQIGINKSIEHIVVHLVY